VAHRPLSPKPTNLRRKIIVKLRFFCVVTAMFALLANVFAQTPPGPVFQIATNCIRPAVPTIPIQILAVSRVQLYGVRCDTTATPIAIAFRSSDPLANLPSAQTFNPPPTLGPLPVSVSLGLASLATLGLQTISVVNSDSGATIDTLVFNVLANNGASGVPTMESPHAMFAAIALVLLGLRTLRRTR
jgi:hypothetical protein